LAITGPLSLTLPAGATLGTASNVGFRLWWIIINDNGVPKLGVRNCSGPVASRTISGFDPRGGTYYTAPIGNSAYVTYSNATAGQFRQYKIIAFADYVNGLATAGQWSASPNRAVLVDAGTPRPGETIQRANRDTNAQQLCNSAAWIGSDIWVQITPTYQLTAMMLRACLDIYLATSSAYGVIEGSVHRFYRNDTTALGLAYQFAGFLAGAGATLPGSGAMSFLDFPFASSLLTYKVWQRMLNGTDGLIYTPWTSGSISVEELMM
jgi:hypothetical protein